MHPRLKTQYFKREDWPEAWIDAALKLIRTEWKRYKTTSPTFPQDTPLFARLDNYDDSDSSDALELYLNSPPVPGVQDPIAYWHSLNRSKGEKDTKVQNPLARMALDILSSPGTS
ncbi:hypothetical protein C8Q76DRAFT_588907, partial [Earliella scabrosa]